jgi:hypothetical protein
MIVISLHLATFILEFVESQNYIASVTKGVIRMVPMVFADLAILFTSCGLTDDTAGG